jgi:hypothetical protein
MVMTASLSTTAVVIAYEYRESSLTVVIAPEVNDGASFTPAGRFGGAVNLDGSDDRVVVEPRVVPEPPLGLEAFTLTTWFRRTGDGVTVSTGTGGIVAERWNCGLKIWSLISVRREMARARRQSAPRPIKPAIAFSSPNAQARPFAP